MFYNLGDSFPCFLFCIKTADVIHSDIVVY